MENFKNLAEATTAFEGLESQLNELAAKLAELSGTGDERAAAIGKLEADLVDFVSTTDNRLIEMETTVQVGQKRLSNLASSFEDVVGRLDRSQSVPAASADGGFSPAWLFGPGGANELVRTSARFEQLVASGWADSPTKVEGGALPPQEA